jgi:shikimate kinase
MRVFLVGFMGVGKSATGRALARRLGALFVDLDGRIEARAAMSIVEVFRRHGEGTFRLAEAGELACCAAYRDVVVATGGGTFTVPANREAIRRLGVSVFLDVPWGEVQRRLPGKRGERPLFGSPEQAQELYRKRLPAYRLADVTLQPAAGEDAEALAGRLALLLEGSR